MDNRLRAAEALWKAEGDISPYLAELGRAGTSPTQYLEQKLDEFNTHALEVILYKANAYGFPKSCFYERFGDDSSGKTIETEAYFVSVMGVQYGPRSFLMLRPSGLFRYACIYGGIPDLKIERDVKNEISTKFEEILDAVHKRRHITERPYGEVRFNIVEE